MQMRFLPAVSALAFAALALTGCGEKAAGDPDAKPGVAVANARLALPVMRANPGAAYFDLTNSGDKPATLAAVAITGAGKTEMHETKGGTMGPVASVAIAPGETVKFEPGGKHVMAFDLSQDFQPGFSTEMTLTFADGDKVTARLRMVAPGAASAKDADEKGSGETHEGMAH